MMSTQFQDDLSSRSNLPTTEKQKNITLLKLIKKTGQFLLGLLVSNIFYFIVIAFPVIIVSFSGLYYIRFLCVGLFFIVTLVNFKVLSFLFNDSSGLTKEAIFAALRIKYNDRVYKLAFVFSLAFWVFVLSLTHYMLGEFLLWGGGMSSDVFLGTLCNIAFLVINYVLLILYSLKSKGLLRNLIFIFLILVLFSPCLYVFYLLLF